MDRGDRSTRRSSILGENMKTLRDALFFILIWGAAAAAAPLKVYTTTPDLADIARRIGGEAVVVESLSRGGQDPHFVEAKPSLIAKLMKADLLVQTGLDLEAGWAPSLVQSARNPKI